MAKTAPLYIEWEKFSVLAIPGISGSGKTSTTRFLLCQLALNGVKLVICDPHGVMPDESLAMTIAPLSFSFLRPIAITKQERIESIQYVNQLMHERLNSGERNHSKIALVIDETTAHFLSCDTSEIAMQAKMFLSLANESRKTNIRVILLGQNWKRDYSGSRDVRSSINAILFHRLSQDETKLFLPSASAQLKRDISNLQTGYAILYSAGNDFTKVKIPFISQDELRNFARNIESRYESRAQGITHESRTNHSMNHAHPSAVNSDFLDERDSQKNTPKNTQINESRYESRNELLHKKIAQMHKMMIAGYPKQYIIKTVFNVSKGSKHKPWLTASKLYDRLAYMIAIRENESSHDE